MHTLIRLLLLACCSSSVAAMDQLVINLIVNGRVQGDVEALHSNNGYWLAEQALKDSGINTLNGESITSDGKRFYRVDTLVGMVNRVDSAELSIYLDAPASEFGEKTLSLSQTHTEKYPTPAPLSGYLSYRLSALHQERAEGLEYQFSPTLNINAQGFNFRTEHDYDSQSQSWRRINSSLEYDRPELMLRATAGDLSPRQAALGLNQAMAGIGIARVFNMQPDFESAPNFQSQAAVTQPSTAEVYLNGQRIKTLDLQPGVYQFNDLQYFSGLQNVEVIIKDQFGGVQSVSVPYYFDDSLLKAGLSEFNYNLGLRRVNGSFNEYDGLAYSAFHRFGLTDYLTLGAEASGNRDDQTYGVLANAKLGRYGVLGAVFSWAEHDTQRNGHAQQIQYRYSNDQWSIYANGQWQSPHYWQNSDAIIPRPNIDWSANIGASWGNGQVGNISVEYARQHSEDREQNLRRFSLGYSFSPWRNTSIQTQIRKTDSHTSNDWSGYLYLSLYFGGGHHLSSGVQYRNEQMLFGSTLSKSATSGEGWGYSLSTQQQEQSTDYIAWLERNLRYGQASASLMQMHGAQGKTTNWRANWQGALAYSNGRFAATRYIYDSFAVVETGLENVAINHNGGLIGHTNADGWLLLPELSNFGYQQLGINQNEIPIEYKVDQLYRELLTGNRDGRTARFSIKKINAITGQLVDENGQAISNQQLRTQLGDQAILISTSMDGQFYTEDLPAGEYILENKSCQARLTITPSKEVVSDLGTVRCTSKENS